MISFCNMQKDLLLSTKKEEMPLINLRISRISSQTEGRRNTKRTAEVLCRKGQSAFKHSSWIAFNQNSFFITQGWIQCLFKHRKDTFKSK